MAAGIGRTRGCGIALGFAFAISCSLSSLDDLKQNADAGTGGAGGAAAQCEQGVDCNGCPTCAYWCACVSTSDVVQCLLACQDDGGGGAGGGGGTGFDASVDAAACKDGDAQTCAECCAAADPAGIEQYSSVVQHCMCSDQAPCFGPCTNYCNGLPAEEGCATCLASDPGVACGNMYCGPPCIGFGNCVGACVSY